ncbi:hypothetical protein LC612_17655 [Nostoc sp. CHAB 5834]|nr:hypothetical protein [Nostoc sp. CHAB 5834]
MNLSLPSSTEVHRLSRRNFIQYSSIWISSSFIAGCTNSNQPSISNSRLDKITFGTNWIAQAEHGGFYQAMATGIYKDYGLDVTIKMGGTQLLMGDAVDFFIFKTQRNAKVYAEERRVINSLRTLLPCALQLVRYTTEERLNEIIRYHEEHGVRALLNGGMNLDVET